MLTAERILWAVEGIILVYFLFLNCTYLLFTPHLRVIEHASGRFDFDRDGMPVLEADRHVSP